MPFGGSVHNGGGGGHQGHDAGMREPPRQLPDASVLAEMPLDMMLQQLQVCV